jgi:hypothetical protein
MSTDPQSLLLEHIASGGNGGVNIEDVIAQIGDADPRLSLVAKYLAHQRAAEKEEDEDRETLDVDSGDSGARRRRQDSPALSRERIEAIKSLQRLARNMFAELEELRQRNDMLALALGACHLCWGEDFECEVCGGKGSPGSIQPDRLMFSTMIAPAVRRLRNTPAESSGTSARQRRSVTERIPNLNQKPN